MSKDRHYAGARFLAGLSLAVLASLFAQSALASTIVWIGLGRSTSQPVAGTTFATDLQVSSWNGAVGAVDLVVEYDPSVLRIVNFSTSADSPFHQNSFADTSSFESGRTRISGFQSTVFDSMTTIQKFGTIGWRIVGEVEGLRQTDITVHTDSVVDARWNPVEVHEIYGQHVAVFQFTLVPGLPTNNSSE